MLINCRNDGAALRRNRTRVWKISNPKWTHRRIINVKKVNVDVATYYMYEPDVPMRALTHNPNKAKLDHLKSLIVTAIQKIQKIKMIVNNQTQSNLKHAIIEKRLMNYIESLQSIFLQKIHKKLVADISRQFVQNPLMQSKSRSATRFLI